MSRHPIGHKGKSSTLVSRMTIIASSAVLPSSSRLSTAPTQPGWKTTFRRARKVRHDIIVLGSSVCSWTIVGAHASTGESLSGSEPVTKGFLGGPQDEPSSSTKHVPCSRPCGPRSHSRSPAFTGSGAIHDRAADAAAEAGRVHQGVERGGVRPLRDAGAETRGIRETRLPLSGDGSTMAIGAPFESGGATGVNGNQNDNSTYASGAVYVFIRQGDSWTQQAYVKASNPGQSDHFGSSVALSRDGNTMAVSAYWEASAATGVDGNQNDNSIAAGRRRLRFHSHGQHLDAAGVHQGLEHRQTRRGRRPSATATSSASRSR